MINGMMKKLKIILKNYQEESKSILQVFLLYITNIETVNRIKSLGHKVKQELISSNYPKIFLLF